MNFLQRIYKAEVIYEPNQKLEIKPAYFIRYFPVVFISVLVGLVAISNFSFSSILFGIIFLFQYVNIFKAIENFSANGKKKLLLIPNQSLPIIHKNKALLKLNKNSFLHLSLKLQKSSINIVITNGAVEVGKYRLNSTEDLKNVLDGFMEIADLEIVESFNLQNREVLLLKPKDKLLQPFSSLSISEANNIINIISIPNSSHWFLINRNHEFLRTQFKKFQIKNIEAILIQQRNKRVTLTLRLKNKDKKVKFFTHKSTETFAILDTRRLADLFQNEKLFKNIRIEL